MKLSKNFSVRFGLLGLVVAVLAVLLCVLCAQEEPALITPAHDARKAAVNMLDAVCRGNYTQASELLSGSPSLGVNRKPDSQAGTIIWDAFVNSLSYELISECYGSGSGVAVDVRFTYMDIDSVTANLQTRSQTLLTQRVELAEDTIEIYDENHEYREDFVMDVLYTAVQEALEQDARFRTESFTLHLIFEDGNWLVVPDQALLHAISGGILN